MPPPPYVAYGLVMFASASMHNLFITFYLELFMEISRLTPWVFYAGQFVYALWNALNDPVVGWLQDNGFTRLFGGTDPSAYRLVRGGRRRSAEATMARRLNSIKYGGALWAVMFLVVWFPPRGEGGGETDHFFSLTLARGAHFVLSMCAYDLMLTLVEVSLSSLLSEIAKSDSERAKFNAHAAFLAGIGSLTSFVGQRVWHSGDLTNFRLACLLIALVACSMFVYSSNKMKSYLMYHDNDDDTEERETRHFDAPDTTTEEDREDEEKENTEKTKNEGISDLSLFLKQIRIQRNFWVHSTVSSLQSFDCAFEKTSFVLFLSRLAGDDFVPKTTKAAVVTGSFLLPWFITFFLTPPVQRYGIYRVVNTIFRLRLALCLAFAIYISLSTTPTLSSYAGAYASAAFLLTNRVASELVCRLNPLVISDVVDEDRYIHRRMRDDAKAGSVVGGISFFSKLGASVAPMLGFFILQGTVPGAHARDLVVAPSPGLRYLLTGVPLACVVLQNYLFTFYFDLHGANLKRVKEYVMDMGDDEGGGGV